MSDKIDNGEPSRTESRIEKLLGVIKGDTGNIDIAMDVTQTVEHHIRLAMVAMASDRGKDTLKFSVSENCKGVDISISADTKRVYITVSRDGDSLFISTMTFGQVASELSREATEYLHLAQIAVTKNPGFWIQEYVNWLCNNGYLAGAASFFPYAKMSALPHKSYEDDSNDRDA